MVKVFPKSANANKQESNTGTRLKIQHNSDAINFHSFKLKSSKYKFENQTKIQRPKQENSRSSIIKVKEQNKQNEDPLKQEKDNKIKNEQSSMSTQGTLNQRFSLGSLRIINVGSKIKKKKSISIIETEDIKQYSQSKIKSYPNNEPETQKYSQSVSNELQSHELQESRQALKITKFSSKELSDKQEQIKQNDGNVSHKDCDCENRQCDVCSQKYCLSKFEVLSCGHSFCKSCLYKILEQNVNNLRVFRCPDSNCQRMTNINILTFTSSLPAQFYQRFRKYSILMSLLGNKNLKLCPNENCIEGIIDIEENENGSTKCKQCGQIYCLKCLMPSHPAYLSCRSWKEQLKQLENQFNYSRCQKCDSVIEKNKGCQHMTCKCGFQFCFRCKVRWRQFHLCSPFNYQHYRWSSDQVKKKPACIDYLEFVIVYIYKVIPAILMLAFLVPLLLAAEVILLILIVVGIFVIGITYGYALKINQLLSKKQFLSVLAIILFFPVGMLQGFSKIWMLFQYKIRQNFVILLRLVDLILPFNLIPFQWL